MMRTTVRLPDDLLAEAKRAAHDERTTVTALLEEALRERLSRRRRVSPVEAIRLSTTGRGGVQPGVDLDDASTLVDVMESS